MLPRLFPTVEQLEQRCVLSVAANPVPADLHNNQTIPAIVQAVRGPVQRLDAPVASAVAAALAPMPLAPIPVTAPPSLPIGGPPTASPLDLPVVTEAPTVSSALEVAFAEEPAVPDAEAVAESPTVVVVTAAAPEPEFMVPAVADAVAEPVRAPSIPLARPGANRPRR